MRNYFNTTAELRASIVAEMRRDLVELRGQRPGPNDGWFLDDWAQMVDDRAHTLNTPRALDRYLTDKCEMLAVEAIGKVLYFIGSDAGIADFNCPF